MQKLAGDSPLRVLMVAFTIIFFVALFVWQIERYLKVGQDSKLQAHLSKMNLIIETDTIESAPRAQLAYLHSSKDISMPLGVSGRHKKFQPEKTLATLWLKNQFSVSPPSRETCYIYSYFPPGGTEDSADFYTHRKPAYFLAGWSRHQLKPVAIGSAKLMAWVEENLTEEDFYCRPKELRPNQAARKSDGEILDVPGYDFQFSTLYYSEVKP